jgi:hypothetical protein
MYISFEKHLTKQMVRFTIYSFHNGGNTGFPTLFNLSEMSLHLEQKNKKTNKLHGLSPRANYTDRATAVTFRTFF